MIDIMGKLAQEIAEEYGVSKAHVLYWARRNNVPRIGDGRGVLYIFDADSEARFKDRDQKRGPKFGHEVPAVSKLPDVPGKLGCPRKEKPVDIQPRLPEIDPVTGKRRRGRPRKPRPDEG